MSTADLVAYLQSLEVSLWLEGDELRWRIPEGVAAPSLETVVACRQDDIAALLGRGPGTTRHHPRPIQPVVREGELPLSFAQQRVWFAAQWDPANPSFNIPSAVRLTGVLDVGAVEQSVNRIIERHEVLRTSFVEVDGRPVQRAAPALVLSVPVVDMSALPGTERQAEARRLMAAEARWSFDLERGPLVRATLLRLDEEEHLLLLTMHHIVSDAWSTEVFARELGELYRGAVTGEPVSLPRLPAQYADYAVWQREWLQGEELDRQRSYWMERLSDAPRVLELPADRPRPPVQSFRGARERFLLSEDLSDRLKALSQEAGTTLFMTLLAAFKVLLYRYTAQADILVGSPIANRNRAEVEGLIGLFVNTVVLRTDLSGNPSFRELLGRVRRTTLEAVASQDLPFEMLLDELQVTRDLSRTPLVQVMMVLSSASRQHSVEAGPSLSVLEIESTTAPFDLTLSMTETVRGLQGAVEYATDLFDAATIVCLAEHLKVVLEKLVADPDQGIADVPILSGAEQHRLLVEWNRTGKGSLHQAGAHELLELKVEQRPDAVAVVCKGQQLTYGELNRRANLLAGHLIELGVGAEDLVGIMMERSAEMIVSQLAVLKAGGAFVPLEPSLPEERLTYMIKDTAAAVILTTAALLEAVPQTEARITCVDEVGCENDACSTTNPGRCTRPEQLAYVIYTSGSTGRPKGVMCRHGGLMNLVEWHSEAYSVCGLDRATQIASAGFDASICEIWPYITAGATLCIVDDEVRKAPDDLLRYVLDQEITVSFMPTQLAEAFLQTAAGTRLPLRCLLAAGDRLSIYADPGWGFALFNNYGPTENTVASTVARVVPAPGHGGGPPIGKPIQGVQAYVLDDRLCPVPVGVPGELCVGGDSLARGYLSRPELTAEAFIPNPFSDEPGSRLYRTGDLVRYLPDGSIEFLGRIDHQVKIRGYRIELGEVEAALSHHPGLAKVVVLARDGDGGDRRLVAYLIPSEGKDPTVGELRGFLLDRLPEYMVPSAFVRLEALPLTPAGKVDQRALPAPDGSRPELDSELVAPRTPTEEVLAGIWAQVLGIEHVGVYDGFFQLGGHSLLATQVVTRVRQAFKVEIPFRAFFDAPTVAEMAEHIDALSLLESDQQAPSEDADFMEWEL